ncbi:hypothetical protein HII31_11743 [Pseudocercospora fuligena]|uniref:Uncharacterized protein n=1 Tax=Pseudocercospora fuligena TaxID=685502 RepID=A0A8H6R9M7_9PEZI|nr:hypothetical protein HII31_11743 [Pseudocercospora fuligena]
MLNERIVVRLLFEQFPNPSDSERRAVIFNIVFAEHHIYMGLKDGRDSDSLKSCWSNRGRKGREAAWRPILEGPLQGAEEKWDELRDRIRSANEALGKDKEERVPVDPEDAKTGDTLCDGCDLNITKENVDSYQCIYCAQSDYCVECYDNPEIEKCHPGKQYVRHTPAQRAEFDASMATNRHDEDEEDEYDNTAQQDVDRIMQNAHPTTEMDSEPPPTAPQNSIRFPSYKETPLEMIHKSQIVWASDTAFWTPDEKHYRPIPHDSPIYKAGGKVHRVTTSGRSDSESFRAEDYMVCSYCPDCGTEDAPFEGENEGTPFVHTADTIKTGQGLTFDPIQNPKFDRQNSKYTDASLHNVVYHDGLPRITALCIVRKCYCYGEALLRGNWEEQARTG